MPMRSFAQSLLGFCLAASLILPFEAAAQSRFTGPYIGATVGYGSNRLDTTKTVTAPVCPDDTVLIGGVCVGASSTISGVTGTALAGYNFAIAHHIIAGIEADMTVSGFKGTFHGDDYDTHWNSTLRGRIGYEMAHGLLAYATAGAGWLNIKVTPGGLSSSTRTLPGYVVGAGLEYALAPHARLRLEYLYSKYRSWDFDPSPTVHERLAPDLHQIRAGVVFPVGP